MVADRCLTPEELIQPMANGEPRLYPVNKGRGVVWQSGLRKVSGYANAGEDT